MSHSNEGDNNVRPPGPPAIRPPAPAQGRSSTPPAQSFHSPTKKHTIGWQGSRSITIKTTNENSQYDSRVDFNHEIYGDPRNIPNPRLIKVLKSPPLSPPPSPPRQGR